MSSKAQVPYSKKKTAKYQGQKLPQESKIAFDPEFEEMARQRAFRNLQSLRKKELTAKRLTANR
jgi:hypothetical protein